jgi:hypothetical protein
LQQRQQLAVDVARDASCWSVLSISASRLDRPLAATCSRRRTNARTTKTLICTASLLRTFAAISAPCSVNAQEGTSAAVELVANCDHIFADGINGCNLEVAICDLKFIARPQ